MEQPFDKTRFGRVIKELRTKNNLSVNDLSTTLNVTPATIKRWETTGCNPKGKHLYHLAKFFNVRVDYLLGL